jgi:hypothetical protein
MGRDVMFWWRKTIMFGIELPYPLRVVELQTLSQSGLDIRETTLPVFIYTERLCDRSILTLSLSLGRPTWANLNKPNLPVPP